MPRRKQPTVPSKKTAAIETKIFAELPVFSWPYIYSILLIVGIALYANTFHNQFVFDDTPSIVDNTYIKDFASLVSAFNIYPTRIFGLFTFALNYHFHQLDVTGYHVVNLAIHILASCVVYWLITLTLSTPAMRSDNISAQKKIIAALGALIFLTHPIQTQAVSYIVQRLASLATLLYLTSLSLYIKARLMKNRLRKRAFLFAGAGLCTLTGMVTKETLFTLPFAVLVSEFFLFRESHHVTPQATLRKWIRYVPVLFFAVLIPCLIMFGKIPVFNPRISQRFGGDPLITPFLYMITQWKVIITYIRLIFIPAGQNLDHDIPLSNTIIEPETLVSFFLLAALAFLAFRLFRKYRIISFGIVWFFLTISVESSIIPIPNVMFEHRLYLPMFGFCLAAPASFYYLLGKTRMKTVVIMIVSLACVYSVLTYGRNRIWKNEFTLWSDVVKKSPDKARPHYNLGKALIEKKQYDRAREEFSRALRIHPGHIKALVSIGNSYFDEENYSKAMDYFSKAIIQVPDCAEAYYNRGNTHLRLKHYNEAILDYNRAMRSMYWHPDFFSNLGSALFHTGKIDEAITNYRGALGHDKDNVLAHYNLGYALYTKGNIDEAAEEFRKVLRLDQSHMQALMNLGSALVSQQKLDEAADYFRKAIAIQPNLEDAHVKLGLLLEHMGQPDSAVEHLLEAVRINPKNILVHQKLAGLYQAQGKESEASIHFNKADGIKNETAGGSPQ
ncbi:tetratricopeptide repeat protein [Candidatus Latescibacterota bacterium]